MRLVGLFLLVISLAMGSFALAYRKTKKLNLAWLCFGIPYAIGIFGILGNSSLKVKLGIDPTTVFFNYWSLILLASGIILAFVFLAQHSERSLILGVLTAVALHFLPFNSLYTYVLTICLVVNCFLGFSDPKLSIDRIVGVDAGLKGLLGVVLLVIG